MITDNYLLIILEGLANHSDYLPEHFYRSYIEAKKKDVELLEFFKRLTEATKLLKTEITNRYYHLLNEHLILEGYLKKEGKDIAELEGQKPVLETTTLFFPKLPNRTYFGELSIEDINNVCNAITETIQKVRVDESKPQSKLLDTINDVKFVLFEQQKKELSLTTEVERHLKTLHSKDEKLKYLQVQKQKYLFNLSLEDFAASGVTSAYFKNDTELFFDRFISNEIKKLENEETGIEISKTKRIILDRFENIDKNTGWRYAFKSESDMNIFIDILTKYFEYNSYSIPKETIELKKDCKTRFAQTLRLIHKELSNENKKLRSDTDFYKILKVLNPFKNLSDIEIYNAIKR